MVKCVDWVSGVDCLESKAELMICSGESKVFIQNWQYEQLFSNTKPSYPAHENK